MLTVGRVASLMFAAGRLTDFVGDLTKMVLDNGPGYICLANVHMLVTATRDRDLQGVMQKALFVAPDGMPLVWLLRRQGFSDVERIAGYDLTIRMCEMAEREGIPVNFYGSTPETINALKNAISRAFPALRVVGYAAPPILPDRPGVDMGVVDHIKASGARIVFVGLGCPKQEFWMAAYSPHLPAILIGVGAAFDFLAGTIRRAPWWMQKAGLEWLYRLFQEPVRLWKRYLVTHTLFTLMVLKEILKGRNQRSERP